MRWPRVPSRRATDRPTWGDGLAWGLVPLAGWAFALAGVSSGPRGHILDNGPLFAWTLRLAAALWLVPTAFFALRRRRRFLDASGLLFFAFIWGVSVLPWSLLILTALDRDLDLRPSARVEARVVSKWRRPSGVPLRKLGLLLPDGETVEVRASEAAFDAAVEGRIVSLEIKPGAFGWRWIVDARLP